MSNIPANNPPKSLADPTPCCQEPRCQEADEPEPSGKSGKGSFRVPIVWDESVSDSRQRCDLEDARLEEAARLAAVHLGFRRGEIGIRMTDDETIHQINREFLAHDYPTDVISFSYAADGDQIEGELVASIQTAEANAAEVGWETAHEVLLYVIHGVLHIGGMDDQMPVDRESMRAAETAVLAALGINNPTARRSDTGGSVS